MIDLTPTTDRTAAVATAVTDEHLDRPTPAGSVRQVLNHLLGLGAFRDAAAKLDGPTTSTPPAPSTTRCPGLARPGAPPTSPRWPPPGGTGAWTG